DFARVDLQLGEQSAQREPRTTWPLGPVQTHVTSGTRLSASTNRPAATAGSAASSTARTSAMRVAPSAITPCTLSSVIPPMAYHGTTRFRAATFRTYASPAAVRPGFVGVSQTGPTAK